MIDVFYDHFLACHWKRFHSLPLAEFAQNVYIGLNSCRNVLSDKLQLQLPHMIEHDWLTSYRRPQVVKKVLIRLEERISHKFPLSQGHVELEQWKVELENDFFAFMDEAKAVVRRWKIEHKSG